MDVRLGRGVVIRHAHDAHHQLRGALHLGKAGLLEARGVEEHAQHGAEIVVGAEVLVFQRLDGLSVGRGRALPGRHAGLVGHKVVVQVAGEEPGGGALADDDVHNVLTVEPAPLAQEGLLAVVVQVGAILKLPQVVAVGVARQAGGQGPAGEGPGAVLNISLTVVGLAIHPHAQGKQLQQLPAEVLVGPAVAVLIVVQPEDHGRVLGQLNEDGAEVAHAVLAEGFNLPVGLGVAVQLGVAGGEDMVPEEGHLLFQGPLGADHAVHPVALVAGHAGAAAEVGHVAVGQVILKGRLVFRVEQLLHRGCVALGSIGLHLVRVGAETGPAEQVSHETGLFSSCHAVTRPP